MGLGFDMASCLDSNFEIDCGDLEERCVCYTYVFEIY